jgi:hypothetical protein
VLAILLHTPMAKKRKAGPRTKSGRLKNRPHRDASLRDLGTREFQDKRHHMINGADPQLAATASGILLANGLLTQEQHHAALRYARWHSLLYGSPWSTCACPLSRELAHHGGSEPTEGLVIHAKRAIDAMNAKLNPEQRQAVANVAVFGFVPTWFYVARGIGRALKEDELERQALISGLDAIAGEPGSRRAA